jgi:hypothetical protein
MSNAFQPYFFNFKLSELSPPGAGNSWPDSPIALSNDISHLFEIAKPKPSPSKLIRIGGNQDGAYLLPDDLAGIEACFSPGVNNIKHFEDELTLGRQIKCHLCDFSCDSNSLKTPLVEGFQTFQKKWLAAKKGDDSITMDEWVEASCQSTQSDLILQMDIEGAEYEILANLDRSVLTRFRCLVIEFHHLHRAFYDQRILEEVCLPVFESLDRDFVCVHAHANNYWPHGHLIPGHAACMPEFLELTFLRRDRFLLKPHQKRFPVKVPHPLDITNVPDNQPFFLEEEWGSGRHWRSKIKIIRERLAFSLRTSLFKE